MDRDRRQEFFGRGPARGATGHGVVAIAFRDFESIGLTGIVLATVVVPGQRSLRGAAGHGSQTAEGIAKSERQLALANIVC